MRFYSMDLSFLPPGQTLDLPNDGHGYKSPLAQMLFNIIGVKSIYLAHEYVTITRETGAVWEDVTPMVQEAILQFAEGDQPILSPDMEETMAAADDDTEPKPEDDEVVLAVKELLATRIRPMVMGDGGNVRYIGFENGEVYVMLEGACKTCPSSGATLKNGIERMLMHWIPEVEQVIECDEDFAFDYRRQLEEKKKKQQEAEAAAGSGGATLPKGSPTAGAA
jgi:Fe-S cluster biogenesis protein NfuA